MATNPETIYESVLEAGIDKNHAIIIGGAARVIVGILSETDKVETLVSLQEYLRITGNGFFEVDRSERIWHIPTKILPVTISFHTPDLLEEPYTKVQALCTSTANGYSVVHRSVLEARDRRVAAIHAQYQ